MTPLDAVCSLSEDVPLGKRVLVAHGPAHHPHPFSLLGPHFPRAADPALTLSFPDQPAPHRHRSPPRGLDASGPRSPARPAARPERLRAEPRSEAGAVCPPAALSALTGTTPVSAPGGVNAGTQSLTAPTLMNSRVDWIVILGLFVPGR